MKINFLSDINVNRAITWLAYALLIGMPLLFGAAHPIVQGTFYAVMLVFFGGWLLINSDSASSHLNFSLFIPITLILYVALQAVPLPVWLVDILSPARAERMQIVEQLTGTVINGISISDRTTLGFYRALCFVALLFYYVTLRQLFDSNTRIYMAVLYILAGIGTFEALYGLLQFAKPHIGTLWLKSFGRGAHGTIIYKNQFASLMNMIWPVVFAMGTVPFLRRKEKIHQSKSKKAKSLFNAFTGTKLQGPLFIFLAGFMVLATVFSLSRGGILSFLFTAFLLTLLLPFSAKIRVSFFAVFFGLVFSFGAILGWDTVISRFASVGGSASGRMSIYLSSIQMALDHWLTGIGLDSYELLSSVYIKWLPITALVDRAHCEYLELIIELGIPMATLLFYWIFLGLYNVFYKLRAEENIRAGVIGIGAWCGLISFLVHGLIDFGWRLPANLFYAVTLLALATGSNTLKKLEKKKKRRKIRKQQTSSKAVFQ